MPIFIYNSLSRKKEPFCPLNPQEIKMYVCGPTVYDLPHIGHARSAYIFDVIKRYLAYKGYKVKFVRNVTDVDDKIIEKARVEFEGEDLNTGVKKVADKYLDLYRKALRDLGIGSQDQVILEPKASEYIAKMIVFIKGLIDKGVAYSAGGDVYFDITKAKDYGKLSNQSLDKMEAGARVGPAENKKNPLDFALWKSAKENEPYWESPWGRGRPGWHIECSVMSSDILGDEFDIHGGGIDLIFPHHENEIAQSEGAGRKFARYWIHHGLLTINSQKMAKSLGNFITVDDFMHKYKNADLLKLFFLSTHYSHPIDYTDGKIEEAKQALERIMILKGKLDEKFPVNNSKTPAQYAQEILSIKEKFIQAMDDDFNTPQALASVFQIVTLANRHIDDVDFINDTRSTLEELLGVLGISFKDIGRIFEVSLSESISIDEEINIKIRKREDARKSKNYALSDKIRKELEAEGIILEDTQDGTTWRRKL